MNEQEVEQRAKELLAQTDWVTCSDIKLDNLDNFLLYRSRLRRFAINPEPNVDLGNPPKPVWTTAE